MTGVQTCALPICFPVTIGFDEETFKKISNAYSVLSDVKKKAEYDSGAQFGGSHSYGSGFNPSDFFSNFFRGGHQGFGNSQAFKKGSNIEFKLSLTLEEIYSGVNKQIDFHKDSTCTSCQGNGSMGGNSFSS